MPLPDDCQPPAPQPPDHRIEVAVRAICDALAGDDFGRPYGEHQRAIEFRTAWLGLRRPGRENPIPTGDYRWALKLMLDTGLLVCLSVKSEPVPFLEDELFDLKELSKLRGYPIPEADASVLNLISTTQLWDKWRATGRIIGPGFYRVRFDKSDRSVLVDGVRLAGELDEDVFNYLLVLVEEYPDPIRWLDIKAKVPTLGENQGRFNTKVDRIGPPFSRRVKIDRKPSHGHSLKLID